MTQNNDQLNVNDKLLGTRQRVMDIMQFFGEMDLSDEQKEKRIKMAQEMETFLIMLLLMLQAEIRLGNPIDEDYYVDYAKRRLIDTAEGNLSLYATSEVGVQKPIINDADLSPNSVVKHPVRSVDSSNPLVVGFVLTQDLINIITDNVRDIIRTTIKNQKDPYYTSKDRATVIAENEANAICNCQELQDAIKNGFKYKTWVTMQDRRVRHTHFAVDNERIGIYDAFKVGRCKMLAPMIFDEGSPEDGKEVINCRCTIEYSKK